MDKFSDGCLQINIHVHTDEAVAYYSFIHLFVNNYIFRSSGSLWHVSRAGPVFDEILKPLNTFLPE